MSKFRRMLMMANLSEPVPPTPVLPYDAEVEYLESSGTQYINTGIIGSSDVSFVFDCYYEKSSNNAALGFIFGSRASLNTKEVAIIHSYIKNFRFGNYQSGNFVNSSDRRLIFNTTESHNVAKVYDENNTLVTTLSTTASTFNNNLSLYLFGMNDNGTPSLASRCRIYGVKLYKGNVLVRDFIPVRVGQVGYMYDKVSGQLFGNQGSGAFTYGNDVYDAEVEWIQTDGSAYIDTGVKPSSDTTFEIDAYIPEHGTLGPWVFGSRSGANAGQLAYMNDGSRNEKSWRFGNKAPVVSPKLAEGWHHFDNTATPRILKIDDSITITAAANTFAQTNYPIYLFCLNVNGTPSLSSIVEGLKIGASKFYQNGTLVFDGIAVRKNGVGYIYDKVSGTLFGNAGTGAFTIGPDKIYDILIRSLTIANGQTPAIITDYYPNENTKVVCSCKLTERPSTSANKCLCGTFTYISSSLYRRFDVQFRNNLNVETNAGDGVNNKASVAYTVNTQINWEFGNGYIIKDGTRTSGTASSAFTANYPLVLFSNCNNGVPTISSTTAGGFVGVIYGNIYIYEGSTLMRCYHPAKKNERVGLWESVTNQMLFSSYGEFSE